MAVPTKVTLLPLPDSTARASDMDAIDKALASGTTATPADDTLAANDVLDQVAQGATPTAGPDATTAQTEQDFADTKLDEQEQEEVAQWRKVLGGPGAQALAAVVKTLRKARGTGNRGAGRIKGGLAGIPIPGDIGVPLILLIVLFVALISVNGHTRFSWLWLVLGGKAHINPKSVTGGVTTNTVAATSNASAGGTFNPGANLPPGYVPLPGIPFSNQYANLTPQSQAAQANPYNNPYGFYSPSTPPNTAKTGLGSTYADILSAGSGGE